MEIVHFRSQHRRRRRHPGLGSLVLKLLSKRFTTPTWLVGNMRMGFLDVTRKIVFDFVRFVAEGAGVRPGFRVVEHVTRERRGVLECLSAYRTREIRFVAVTTHVVLQFVFGSESLRGRAKEQKG